MKRIAIAVSNPMGRHGVTSVILNLLKSLDRSQFEICFISALRMEDWFCEELRELNIEIIRLHSKRIKQPLKYIKELSSVLRERQIDTVHVHGNSATMWFEIKAAKSAGVGCRIAHSHSSNCKSRVLHNLLRPRLIRDMTLGIGCSDLSREFAFKNHKKSIILNNGIDTDKFKFNAQVREQYRADFGIEKDFIIGHVGNFLPAKNHIFMCEIAKELKRRSIEGWRIMMVGGGTGFDAIERYANENNIADKIMLPGLRSDADKLYQMFDLKILPSHHEGFPMVLIEAQTAGLKCMISENVTKTTNLLGNAEYLQISGDGAAALWADAICRAMDEYCDGDLEQRALAKDKIDEAGYSVKQSAQLLKDLYLNGVN